MMRVTDYQVTAGLESTTRAGEPEKGARAGTARPVNGDRVEVSNLAGTVADALARADEQRQSRIEQLRAAWNSGSLQDDPARVSQALIGVMLAGNEPFPITAR